MNSTKTLEEFKDLKNNWNGYDADPIDIDIIEKAIYLDKLIPFDTQVFPTAANSVQFDFEDGFRYLEIDIEKDNLTIFEMLDEGKELEIKLEFNTKGIIEVLNHIKLFYKKEVKDIALFSGAFNPPTKAHYHVMKKILETKTCDTVAIALCNEEFLNKKAKKHNFSFYYSEEDRLFMMLKMTALNKDILIYGIEDGYTYDVLNNVKNKLKTIEEDKLEKANVHFIAGSDKISQMKKWGHSKELLNNFSFIILTRGDSKDIETLCKETYKNYSIIDTSTYKDVSSTIVRNKIKNNENISSLVTKDVEDAINLFKHRV